MESEHAHCAHEEAQSTGFLPITLALGLFLMGLFALGVVPKAGCGATASAPPTAPSY